MKAGCPSEVCIKCGKPKRPFFTDTGRYYVHDRNGEYVDEKYLEYHPKDGKTKIADATNVSISSVFNTNPIKERVTNWIPSCNCNAGFKPGVVLDPFAGSGTVGIVAKKQGKSAILIEINPEYLQIIKDRLEITGEGTKIDVNFVEVASPDNWEEDE
jgi:tRNA/tmRNA/rRNA uracil-C5-methylase (TrmA/RlmC/RlmD family)